METKTIVMCVVALLLGILMADMLQNVCGCKDIVEGQEAVPPNSVVPPCYQIHIPTACDDTYAGGGKCLGGHIVQDPYLANSDTCKLQINSLVEAGMIECPDIFDTKEGKAWVDSGAWCLKRAAPTATDPGPGVPPPGPDPHAEQCWEGAYTHDRCCDLKLGSTGDDACWSVGFDYQYCCTDPDPAPSTDPSPTTSGDCTGRCKLTFDSDGHATINLNSCIRS